MLAVWKAAVDEFQRGSDFVVATILSVRGPLPGMWEPGFLSGKTGP